MKDYAELTQSLSAKGIGAYFAREHQLVISNNYPPIPSSNCFWVTKKNNDWYIATWLPAIYAIPENQDVAEVCESVYHSSPTAIYTVDEVLENKFALRRLSDAETEELGL